MCPEAEQDPAAFAKHTVPSMITHTERYFQKVKFFAASAVGSSANAITRHGMWQVPLHVQPKGIVEPLEWLMKA
jgi:hypothetical protein